jgi:peptidylprolyl isomerase
MNHLSAYQVSQKKGITMAQATQGDTVRVHYTGRLDDGTVFDSSRDGDPLEFTIGGGNIIAGFEQAVVGMSPGESRTTAIPPDQAYGPYRDEMVTVVNRRQFPPNLNPEVGDELQVRLPDGRSTTVTVREITATTATLDGNHPLAGQALTFDIELVEIV